MSGLAPVGVVVPCYRQAKYLPEALESLRAQTLPPKIVVVIAADAESDRAARDYFSEWRGPCDFLLRLRSPGGRADALHDGFSALRLISGIHHFLALDADDVLSARALEIAVAAADDIEGLPTIVSSDLERFGGASGVLPLHSYSPQNQVLDNHLHTSSLFSRELWDAIGGHDPVLPTYEDWAFWAAAGGLPRPPAVLYVAPPMLRYRVHAGQWHDHPDFAPLDRSVRAAIQILNWRIHPARGTAEEDRTLGRLVRELREEFERLAPGPRGKWLERFERWPDHPTTRALRPLLQGRT